MPIHTNSIVIFSSLTCFSKALGTNTAHYHPPLLRGPKICIKRKFLADPICDFRSMCKFYNDMSNPLLSRYPNEVQGNALLKIIVAHENAHYFRGKNYTNANFTRTHSLVWKKKYHLFLRALFDIRGTSNG